MIGFRLGEKDYEWLTREAEDEGIAISRYVRTLVRAARITHNNLGPVALIDEKTSFQLLRELRYQGHNLNQGIKAINTIALCIERRHDTDLLLAEFQKAKVALGQVIDLHSQVQTDIDTIKGRLLLGGHS